jgi:hypothetical protein
MMEQSMLSLFAQFPIAKAFFQNASELVVIKTLNIIKEEIEDDDDDTKTSILRLAYYNFVSLLGAGSRSSKFRKLLPKDRFPFVLDYYYNPLHDLVMFNDGVLIDSLYSFMAWYTNLNHYRKTYVLEKTAFALQCTPVNVLFGFSPKIVAVEGSDDLECWLHNERLTPDHALWEGCSVQWATFFDFADEVSIAVAFISGTMTEGIFYPECCFQSDIHYPSVDTQVAYENKVWFRYRQNGAQYGKTLRVPTYYFEGSSLKHVFYPSPELCDVIRMEMGEHATIHNPSFHYSGCHMETLDFDVGGPVEAAKCTCPTISNRVYYFDYINILKMYVDDDDEETDEDESLDDDDNEKVKLVVLKPTDTRFDHYGEDWSITSDSSECR